MGLKTRTEQRVRRAVELQRRTADLWLCQCVVCGTNNPTYPRFREQRNAAECVAVSLAATKIPDTCAGCGQPLQTFDATGITHEGAGQKRERRAELRQAQRKSREARAAARKAGI